jgi:SAM-dependent methyltransferase
MSSFAEKEQLKELYERREESAESYAHCQFEMACRVQKYLRRDGYCLEGLKVVDIGCGQGGESCGYVSQNPSILVAVDINFELLRTAVNFARRKNTRPLFVGADVFKLPFQNASFDVIFSNGMIEHLPGIDGLFPSLYRILRPGGLARLSFAAWWGPFAGHIRDQLPYPYIHLLPRTWVYWLIDHCRLAPHMTPERVKWKYDSCFTYTGWQVRAMAERHGFEIIGEKYEIPTHPAWSAFRMSIAKILGLRPYTAGEVWRVLRECLNFTLPFSLLFWILRHLFRISWMFREYAPDCYVLQLRRPKERIQY